MLVNCIFGRSAPHPIGQLFTFKILFQKNYFVESSPLTLDGTIIAVGAGNDADGQSQFSVFDANTGKETFSAVTAVGSDGWARCTTHFLPDGRTLAFIKDSQIKFWDVQSKTNTRSLEFNSPVSFFTISSDGKTMAVSTEDHLISIWDIKSGTRLRTLPGHQALVFSLAFSPDGRTLASGSEDRTIKLWHVATGRELCSFTQEKGVYWLTFSPDNQMLVSGQIGSYQFWRAPRGDDAAPMPVVPKIALADLPTNSIWRLPDGNGMNPAPAPQ